MGRRAWDIRGRADSDPSSVKVERSEGGHHLWWPPSAVSISAVQSVVDYAARSIGSGLLPAQIT